MIVLIGGEKGGVGKSLTAVQLAALRAQEGHQVLLVDTDIQGSAAGWAQHRLERDDVVPVRCVQVFGKAVTNMVQDLATRYDDVIIDAGGRDSPELRAGMVVADVLVSPFRPAQFDLWTATKMNELMQLVEPINPSLRCLIFVNGASPNPRVSETEEANDYLADYEHLDFTGLVIRDRIAFRRSVRRGLSVIELQDNERDEKAIVEMTALYDLIFKQTKPQR